MFEIKNVKKPLQKPPVSKVASAFKNAMDDEDTSSRPKISQVGAPIAQVSYQKMLDETSKIILEDPSVYSYDTHYDEINEKRQELQQQKKEKAGSRYIGNLLKASEKRKVEQSMIYEKMAEKELKREGNSSNSLKFVTNSYKRMMEEGKKFQQEDEEKEQYNKAHGAENQDNMGGLYRDLYKQDIFMGGFRPDLATIMKQPKVEAPVQEKLEEKAAERAPARQEETQPSQLNRPSEAASEKRVESRPTERVQQPKEERKRDKSRSRSRSRSKSPTSITALKEEQKAQKEVEKEKEKEKELSKEEKLRLLKERYQQRKTTQAAAPNPNPEQN